MPEPMRHRHVNGANGQAYRLDDDDALAATCMEGAAILTSTSSIGFFVQAWVT